MPPDLSAIKKPLPEQTHETIVGLAIATEVVPDAHPLPDPPPAPDPEVEPDPDAPPPEPEPTIEELLTGEPTDRLIDKLVSELTDEELKSMPVVKDRKRLRPHRGDWEAAARGEMVETEREEATQASVKRENERAPSAEDVEKLNAPPTVEITYGEPRPIYTDGELVGYAPALPESVKVQRWAMGEDGRPELVVSEGTL